MNVAFAIAMSTDGWIPRQESAPGPGGVTSPSQRSSVAPRGLPGPGGGNSLNDEFLTAHEARNPLWACLLPLPPGPGRFLASGPFANVGGKTLGNEGRVRDTLWSLWIVWCT